MNILKNMWRLAFKPPDDVWDHDWPLEKKLEYMAKLEPNWDSYGGDPISPEAIEVARLILTNNDTTEGYTVCPVGDGGVGVYWKSGGTELQLEIEADGGFFITAIPPNWHENNHDMLHFQIPPRR